MKFRVLAAALDDIDGIDIWVTEHFDDAIAAATTGRLFAEFRLLAEFPELGRVRGDVTTRPVRFLLSGPYWIIYEATEPLLIHRVFHAARDLSQLNLK